jgi:phage FluMu gp28-like protein
LIVAAGERQARESLEKAREWAELVHRFAQLSGATDATRAMASASEIRFANGSRITALPGKPATIRGYSANVILTEFAFHDDPEAVWQAVFPSVSNPLRGGQKKLRIITTPNGQGNFFHRLWQNAEGFSKHRLTIHEALAQGLPVNLARLRAGIFDPNAWAQEYECEFLDGTSVLLPYELIESCESADATESSTPETLGTLRGELFAGIDFGRKQDLTVCWILEKVLRRDPLLPAGRKEFQLITREVLVLDRLSTPAQLEMLRPRIARVRRACLDYTGAGIGLGDLLVREFGERAASSNGKVELCHFSAALKSELFPSLRAAFERGRILIPRSASIREDLHGVQKFVSATGGISYRAGHTADGHSDRCTALALAVRAADAGPTLTCARSIDVPMRSIL